jgi:hypothetical protein
VRRATEKLISRQTRVRTTILDAFVHQIKDAAKSLFLAPSPKMAFRSEPICLGIGVALASLPPLCTTPPPYPDERRASFNEPHRNACGSALEPQSASLTRSLAVVNKRSREISNHFITRLGLRLSHTPVLSSLD